MRAAAFTSLTGPDGVELIEQADPDPGDGEAVVDVEACSINRHDLWILEGDSAMVNEGVLPFVTGLDVAGTVRETGAGASVSEGDRVLLCPNQTCGECRYCREGPENLCQSFMLYHGGLAEQALVDGSRLIPLPDDLSAQTAACLPTAYLTAWHMYRKADLTAGDRVFVPGATGGVGVAAVQLADVLGLEAVGTTTSETKAERLRELGCPHVVVSGDTDEIVREVRSIGEMDGALNHLAGEFTAVAAKVLRRGAKQVVCGRTAGSRVDTAAAPFFLQHQEIVGSTMGTQPELERLVDLAASGAFEPVVGGTYDLDATGEAFRDMAERDAFGKLVVEP
ncbi:quinone oxidoreductase family protein [Halorarius litoreus]|uniref:quinone oxidoreductase family protein n=1 Tax=Halorarius litoreus TaxID=2962676 RepID=UPI0020CC6D6A|nr:alcohol dehydrogenase catalytic domain-containing protein [Halorarius litoreus]